jgi:hypothetical protein
MFPACARGGRRRAAAPGHLTPQPPLHVVERGSWIGLCAGFAADSCADIRTEPLSTSWRGVAEGRGEVPRAVPRITRTRTCRDALAPNASVEP